MYGLVRVWSIPHIHSLHRSATMSTVVRSPVEVDAGEIPEIGLAEFLLARLAEDMGKWGDRPWIIDIMNNTSINFCDLEDHSRRIASALTRKGFKKGDVLYFVTYESAQLYLIHLAVWRLGGAVRGNYQQEEASEFTRQLRETRSRFLVVDVDTAPLLLKATSQLEWSVQRMSVGNVKVPGVTCFTELLQDDGLAFPEKVDVNPREDIVTIPNTSGSTGMPKGVLHTHYTAIASIFGAIPMDFMTRGQSCISLMSNFAIGNFLLTINTLCSGVTMYNVGKFNTDTYFGYLTKYKPENVMLYPYVATWFVRSKEIESLDMSFIKKIYIGGWVLDHTTSDLLTKRLPGAKLVQIYAMTETMLVSTTNVGKSATERAPLPTAENQGEICVSSGQLCPLVQGKVIDVTTGETLGRGKRGEILVKSPYLMKGYLVPGKAPNRADIDDDGWLHTGDLGFFDDAGNIYIKERVSFMFKYYMQYISPAEIESVLQEHDSVQAAGVVGIPHPETTSLARALVVLRDGCSATCQQLQRHVAERLPAYMHLHGGVRFLPMLPMNRGGKLDRGALKRLALQEESDEKS